MKKLIMLLLPVLLVYSCRKVDSNDLKDDVPYYQSYSVIYDKVANNVNVSGFCRVRDANGTKVQFSSGAGLTANGATPSVDIFDKAIYRWNFNSIQDVNFVLTKNSGTKINNTVTLSDISNSDFGAGFPTTVSKASGFSFNFTGDALTGTESLTINIAADSGTKEKILTQLNTGNTVNISSSDLQGLKTGNLNITMTRENNLPLDNKDGTAGGTILMRFIVKRAATLTP
jgi:hypothetical protein